MLEWAHAKMGWPSAYANAGEMPAETAMAYEYLVRAEKAAAISPELLETVADAADAEWKRLLQGG